MDFNIQDLQQYLIEELKTNQFLSGGLLITIITSILYSLRKVPMFLWERIKRLIYFEALVEERNSFYDDVERWLYDNYSQSYRSTKVKRIRYFDENVNKDISKLEIQQLEDWFFIRRNGKTIKISKNRKEKENASDLDAMFYESIKFSSLFGKKEILNLLEEIRVYGDNLKNNKDSIEIYEYNFDGWDKVNDMEVKSVDDVFINNKNYLLDDLNNFVNAKEWYKKRNIPYKRGYGLWGTPGNGKTTLALALAKYLNRDIYVINLNECTDGTLKNAFKNIFCNSILLMEDIDCVFSDRKTSNNTNKNKNVNENTTKSSVSLSTMLNCLDGIFYKEGLITIMTSNHPEKLDNALIRRGRVDVSFNINNPTYNLIEDYILRFYDNMNNIKLNVPNDLRNKESGYSMVDIQNICLNNINDVNNTLKIIYNECMEKYCVNEKISHDINLNE